MVLQSLSDNDRLFSWETVLVGFFGFCGAGFVLNSLNELAFALWFGINCFLMVVVLPLVFIARYGFRRNQRREARSTPHLPPSEVTQAITRWACERD